MVTCSLPAVTAPLRLSLLLLALPALAGDPPKDILDLVHSTEFRRVVRVQGLPSRVQEELHRALQMRYEKLKKEMERDPQFMAEPPEVRASFFKIANSRIANPGEPWTSTDDIADIALPMRRLVFAGASTEIWFIFYQHGGHGRHSHVLVIGKDFKDDYWSRWIDFAKVQSTRGKSGRIEKIRDGRVVDNEEGFDE